jgi:two-component system, NtrC family, nitrogen regulation sensor histidine kinase NtrY
MIGWRVGVGLQVKLVFGLLIVAAVPLLVSAILVDQIAVVAQNFASNEAERLRPPLVKAQAAYRDLVQARKQLYRETGGRIADRLRAQSSLWADPADLARLASGLRAAATHPDLARIAVLDASGGELAAGTGVNAPAPASGRRTLVVTEPLPAERRLELTFVIRVEFLDDMNALGAALDRHDRLAAVRSSLPRSYRTGFLLVVGAVVVAVTAAGIFMARRLTQRIAHLVAGTRNVAAGNLDGQVALRGRDELAQLSHAFNLMVAQLKRDRQQIGYLQKMAAWQDVARHLAHEIKNPLTPIQLVVQQLHSGYQGDDPTFRATLKEAEDIVAEEIAGLRRLVDAFQSLGRLPPVQASRLDLAVVVQDLHRDPALADQLRTSPPEGDPVEVDGDRLLLRRLLANLIENGIAAGRAAGRPGQVHMHWRRQGDCAVVVVDDHGSGVVADQRERIFEPYVTGKEHGTGLGLAIAKKIALEHHGSLEVDPQPAPEGGARFVLTLPLFRGDRVGPVADS